MKKIFRLILMGIGAFLVLLIVVLTAAAIIIPIKYPPEKMKAMATDKLSETLRRKVSIGNVHFSVFSGFEMSDLEISNRPGWSAGSFVSAKEISVSYHIWPLLTGRIALGEIKLVEPQILVERRGLNQFNFTDIMGADVKPAMGAAASSSVPTSKGASSTAANAGTGAFLLSVDSLRLDHGKMAYLDETAPAAQRYDLGDLNFRLNNISFLGGKTTFSLDTPFTYNKLPYHLSVGGALRYNGAKQSLKEIQVTGKVNDLDFEVSGGAQNVTGDFAPEMDGSASLDMLKFSGLVPKSLSSMPEGLSLTGPARVAFHLSGSSSQGLKLKGTADGTDLSIHYKDLFVKEPKAVCKLDFTSVMAPAYYELSSFHASFKDWEMDGAFHYQNGNYYSCELHSKSLPLKGIPETVPKWAKATFSGNASSGFENVPKAWEAQDSPTEWPGGLEWHRHYLTGGPPHF